MTVYEVNFDGIVGPTHHYAGLAYGNEASMQHATQVSNPKAAALQGLDKMQVLHDLGVKQGFLLPHKRPAMGVLHQLGFMGDEQRTLEKVYKTHPQLFTAVFSAASMWTANAATVTAAVDAGDDQLHITAANLSSQLHRAIEAEETMAMLEEAFSGVAQVHAPLPFGAQFSDEGAANHMRLSASHDQPGVNVFVYGKTAFEQISPALRYPARQTREASESIARNHAITQPVIFLQQHPDAIDAGVFHNDVIATSNEYVLLYHEKAFADPQAIEKIRDLCDFDLKTICIHESELSLKEAVSTYLFNSQIVTVPNGDMHWVMPTECEHSDAVQRMVARLLSGSSPIKQVHYVNCRQSMHNGGGPACLRLRVLMDEHAFQDMDKRFLLNDKKIIQLRACIERYYPENITIPDFLDPALRAQCAHALAELHALCAV